LLAAEGVANTRIAELTDATVTTVLNWRGRYQRRGIAGLRDAPRAGRPRSLDHRAIVAETLKPPPKRLGVTHWSSRLLAQRLKVSASAIQRAWRAYGVKPWKAESFRFSTDPELVGKVTDICGLYLAPPENAIVLCVDEKSQIQALDRTVPILPMQPGKVERRSHDYYRHGTTTLFAALDIATGEVTAALKPRHRHQEFLAFLKQIERTYRDVLDADGKPVELHLVMDNYAAHKHPNVKAWLTGNPRFVVHFTPDPRLLDEPRGGLVWHRRAPGHPPRRVQVRQGPQRQDPRLHRCLARTGASIRLDKDRRPDLGQGQPSNNFKSAALAAGGYRSARRLDSVCASRRSRAPISARLSGENRLSTPVRVRAHFGWPPRSNTAAAIPQLPSTTSPGLAA